MLVFVDIPSWGPAKTKGKLVQGTRLRESLENRKGGEVLPSTKKQKNQTNISTQKNKRRYRCTSSSSSTEMSYPSPKRHKSRRKKRKHLKRSSSLSYSSSPSSFSESSETRSIEGSLGSQFQVITEEAKFRYNLPTAMAEYANTHFGRSKTGRSKTANINGKSSAR